MQGVKNVVGVYMASFAGTPGSFWKAVTIGRSGWVLHARVFCLCPVSTTKKHLSYIYDTWVWTQVMQADKSQGAVAIEFVHTTHYSIDMYIIWLPVTIGHIHHQANPQLYYSEFRYVINDNSKKPPTADTSSTIESY